MDDIFKLLAKRIDEYEEDIKGFLASGQAEDMAMYNRIGGKKRGITVHSARLSRNRKEIY